MAASEDTEESLNSLSRPSSMPSFMDTADLHFGDMAQTLPVRMSPTRAMGFKPWKSMSSRDFASPFSPTFGTPSYPSPLDRIRGDDFKVQSAIDLYTLSEETNNNDIYLNPFKHMKQERNYRNENALTASKRDLGESLHSFSFAPGFIRGSFASSPTPHLNASLNASWQFFNFVGGAEVGAVFPTTARNPNKAIFTIDARTSRILMANEMACKLFGFRDVDLEGKKISELFTMEDGYKQDALLEHHIDTEGNIVMVSGKVLEAVNAAGDIFAVSLWLKRVKSDDDPRCIAVIEPVERTVASFLFNAEGTIIDCDAPFALLHGYTGPEEVAGLNIQKLIPAFILPIPGHKIEKHIRKQRATGKTKENTRFPVSIRITEHDKDFHEMYLRRGDPDNIQFSKFLYKGILWIFANVSGLISVTPDGEVHSCNDNFALTLFGFSEKELVGESITYLIPTFYEEIELAEEGSLRLPSLSDDEVQLDPKRTVVYSEEIDYRGFHSPFRNMEPLEHKDSIKNRDDESETDSAIQSAEGSPLYQTSTSDTIHSHPASSNIRNWTEEVAPHYSGGYLFSPRGEEECIEEEESFEITPSDIRPQKASTPEKAELIDLISPSSNLSIIDDLQGLSSASSPKKVSNLNNEVKDEYNSPEELSPKVVKSQDSFVVVDTPKPEANGNPKNSCGNTGSTTSLSEMSNSWIVLDATGEDNTENQFEEVITLEDTKSEEQINRSDDTISNELFVEGQDVLSDEQVDNLEVIMHNEVIDRSKVIISDDVGSEPVSDEQVKRSIDVISDEEYNPLKNEQLNTESKKHTRNKSESDSSYSSFPESSGTIGPSELTDSSTNTSTCDKSCCREEERESKHLITDFELNSINEERPSTSFSERVNSGSQSDLKSSKIPLSTNLSSTNDDSAVDSSQHRGQFIEKDGSAITDSIPVKDSNADDAVTRGNQYVEKDGSVITDFSSSKNDDNSRCPRKGIVREDSSGSVGIQSNDDTISLRSQGTSSSKAERNSAKKIVEGNFYAQARHKDGSLLPIVFQIKRIVVNKSQELFCIWVSRDPEEQGEGRRVASHLMLAGSFSSTMNASHSNLAEALRAMKELKVASEEPSPGRGRYDERYLTLQSIGKGAFGFVKLAKRRSDGLPVVVKFIQKNKIVHDNWVEDPNLGLAPLEICLLAKFDHPSIVQMYEAFENEEFFQMVMEKHGDGIDLFEFIDRQPQMDEALASYMFRQVVSAVSYLHSKNIIHRDVKDENIIIDRKFRLKLIDFGSASYTEENKWFNTFCGTVEYCSPEVLLGNKYRGPELEMWSMGITLYTLIYGENPFYDIEETIEAELHPPFRVSAELMFLMCWMLHPDPRLRSTIKDVETNKWITQDVDITRYDYDIVIAGHPDDFGNPDAGGNDFNYDYEDAHDQIDPYEHEREHQLLEDEYTRYLQRQGSLVGQDDQGRSF